MRSFNNYFKINLILIISLTFNVWAQKKASVSGIIYNAETKKVIQDVNIYIANSTLGTTSNKMGKYKISGLDKGNYKLIISSIGYKRIVKNLFIPDAKQYHFSFYLEPKIYELPTVIIDEEAKDLWKERLDTFINQFIGQSRNAERCELENPYIIEFEEKDGALSASAPEPLVIYNYALGYRIDYFLEYFSYQPPHTFYKGLPVFSELDPIDEEEERSWEEARLKTYCGSLRHFLRAASEDWDERQELKEAGMLAKIEDYEGVLERQGFIVFHFSYINANKKQIIYQGISTDKYIYPTVNDFEKIISFKEAMEIIYSRKVEDPNYLDFIYENRWPEAPVSRIYLHADSVKFDTKGRYFDEFKIQTIDYWAFQRLADMLPFEYSVPDSILESIYFEE